MGTTLGRNIKAFRKNKGLTQEELANLLNITPQAVSKWESEAGLPDVSMIIPLAQILNVSTDALLGYDTLSENDAVTARVEKTVAGMADEKDRAGSKLKICEYLSTETNLNPGNFEVIKSYVQEAAGLSMYTDPTLGNSFPGEEERLQKIFKDSIRKGAYLISHCSDRVLVEKTHYALAWIYIHNKDFDNARDHVNVLPSLMSNRLKENLDMELVFFESGFEKMKDVIADNEKLMFNSIGKILYTISTNYGWWGEKDEAVRVCDWCESIVKAFVTRKESLEFSQYLAVRSYITFNKMVAFHKAGENDKAKELYNAYETELSSMELSEDEKKDAMDRLDHEVSYYKIFE